MAYASAEKKRLADLTRRQRNKDYVDELRANTPCADCLQSFPPYCMDFDHTGDDKSANVMDLVFVPVSLVKLEAEIAKTTLVCAVCHRIRTQLRKAQPAR